MDRPTLVLVWSSYIGIQAIVFV